MTAADPLREHVGTAWVTVSDWLWHCALREMDPKPIWPDRTDINPDVSSEYPRVLVQAVVDYLSEDLMCDHQVNICMCSTISVVEELNLNLAGRETCRRCGGEGFRWNKAKFEAAKALHESREPDNWWDISESEGYDPCVFCGKTGRVEAGFDYDGVSEA